MICVILNLIVNKFSFKNFLIYVLLLKSFGFKKYCSFNNSKKSLISLLNRVDKFIKKS
jgi:hypothetical protein